VFCGSTTAKITREHLAPKWISDLFPDAGIGTSEILRRDGSMTTYNIEVFSQTVRAPCQGCNNGWMSVLEERVKRLLGPMIRHGQATKLRPPAQALIATWAIKTAFMYEYLHPAERVVPDSEYHRFYKIKQPPDDYRVWLAHRTIYTDHTGRELLMASREQHVTNLNATNEASKQEIEAWLASGGSVFRITFTIGRLVFQIFGHSLPGRFNVEVAPNVKVVQLIWPVNGNVTWPPPNPVEQIGGIDGLHAAFDQPPPGR